MDISRRVGNLKRRWGTADPFKICSFLKIQVNYSDLGDIKGFYKNILGKKFIVINSELNTFDKKIVCAHELGHCLLHSSKEIKFLLEHNNLAKHSLYEKQANEFAAHLVIEDEENEYFYSSIKSELLNEIKFYKK